MLQDVCIWFDNEAFFGNKISNTKSNPNPKPKTNPNPDPFAEILYNFG